MKFEIDDAEEDWAYREHFDFVHIRYLAAAIRDWPRLARQAYEFTTPGGFVEFQDFDLTYYCEDGSLTEDLHISKWIMELLDASRGFQRDPCPGPKLEKLVKDAGFQNVTAQRYKLPIGPWAKDPHLVSSSLENDSTKCDELKLMSTRKPLARGIWCRSRRAWKVSLSDCSQVCSDGKQRRCKFYLRMFERISGILRYMHNLICESKTLNEE